MAAFTVVAVFLAGMAFAWVRSHTPRALEPTSLPGTLIYAVDERDGWSRLWKWDLAVGTVSQGPRVKDPVQLVNAFGANFGWVGVTSQGSNGSLVASILRFLGPGDAATEVARGDLVSWGARGAGVIAAKRGPVIQGCRRHLVIVFRELVPSLFERQFNETVCGDILSIARDSGTTYMTYQRRDHITIVYAGFHRVHRVLRDHALIAVSTASDMLVVPASELGIAPISPLSVRADPDPLPTGVFGTALFFRGPATSPIPYGVGDDRMEVDRLLAWSPDSLVALVAGRLGNEAGIFELDAGPGDGLRPPRFVAPIDGLTWATYVDEPNNTGVVVMDGRLFTLRGQVLSPLQLPDGAPTPDGPIVWTR